MPIFPWLFKVSRNVRLIRCKHFDAVVAFVRRFDLSDAMTRLLRQRPQTTIRSYALWNGTICKDTAAQKKYTYNIKDFIRMVKNYFHDLKMLVTNWFCASVAFTDSDDLIWRHSLASQRLKWRTFRVCLTEISFDKKSERLNYKTLSKIRNIKIRRISWDWRSRRKRRGILSVALWK